ncbi:flavodoxin domain-containing protein [Mucilaginibacter xinganensis]|uniref:Protoporphyrinogen IX oxidase, menaquinone-dependent (Flavodoxin domain) n=1 Tax=Mucilaginibacter xinganensis TaxID=1234841 RepID=A0A223NW64_9SPHI|nr:flavodoxin domain-containing protein [Mucilaginibacter xinganensis]ASU34112.1 Protoporphyrinogen IX oxidase, menaquinone-dependent (flavodoxin domain) [Mucilaginibacter xinganensis]
MKGIIIYQGKYGATERYAQWLNESLHLSIMKAGDATPEILAGYDLIILGSSVYVGKLVMRKWLEQNLSLFTGKKLIMFIVCGTTSENKSQQQQLINNNLDPLIRNTTKVFFLPGRCIVSKLSWMDRVILKMGAMLEKEPVKKAAMNKDFDRMDKKYLDSVITVAGSYLNK